MLSAAPSASAANCSSFHDVSSSSPFCKDIRWLSTHHITGGYRDHGFHPGAKVSRQAMASFMYKLTNPGKTAPRCGTDAFPDVPMTGRFCGDVAWLDGEAVTGGYKDHGFHPTAGVSRQAMASFMYRLSNPGDKPAACTSAPYNDVPKSDRFCGAIRWLVGKKITHGYPGNGFHPAALVSRQAMAAFLHRLDAKLTLRAGYVVFGSGTHRVGTDIPAGTYRTRHASELCYWERLSGFSGSVDDIIADDAAGGPAVVTISKSDAGFKTDSCAMWTSNLSRLSASRTKRIGDGTWIVGTDLKPGEWRTTGGDDCYWERDSNFSGSFDAIIANDSPTGPAVVDIEKADKAFRSDGCGTWKRIG
jgi:hypothetical protein